VVGLGLFTLASLACGLAPSPTTLVLARVAQGVAGAVVMPQVLAIIGVTYRGPDYVRALSLYGVVLGLAAVGGQVIGGALVESDLAGLGWRSCFLINVPVGIAALALAPRLVPESRAERNPRMDVAGAALLAAGLSAVLLPLIEGREHGWPAWSFAMLAGGVAALVAFGFRQNRRVRAGRTALVEPSILRRRPYVAGLAVVVGFIGAMGGMTLALNVMFQVGLGFSPLACGIATVAIPLAAIGGSITSSALLARIGRRTMHIGIATMAGGLVVTDLVLHSAGGGLSAWQLAAPLAVTGFGMGMVFVPMFDVILAGVRPHELGSASGLLESVQQLAMSLGIALVGTALFGHLAGHDPAAFVGAAGHALLLAIAFLAAAWAAVFWLPGHAAATAAG
jgi:MFS family permease